MLAGAVVVVAPGSARAQEPSTQPAPSARPAPPRHHHTITGFFARALSPGLDLTSAGGIFEFTYVPDGLPWIFFGGSMGFVWTERFARFDPSMSGSVGYGQGSMGELLVGIQTATEREQLRMGLGFHPNVPIGDRDDWLLEAYRLFAVPYGGSRTWRWRPDAMALHLDLSIETFAREGPWFHASTSLALLFLTVGDGVELFGEGAVGAGHWVGPLLLGARAVAVVGAPGSIAYRSGTAAQVSLEPFVRLWADVLEIEIAVNATIGGAPAAWEELGAWGVRLSVGDRF